MGFGVSCWSGWVLSGPNSPAAKPWTCKACVVRPAAGPAHVFAGDQQTMVAAILHQTVQLIAGQCKPC